MKTSAIVLSVALGGTALFIGANLAFRTLIEAHPKKAQIKQTVQKPDPGSKRTVLHLGAVEANLRNSQFEHSVKSNVSVEVEASSQQELDAVQANFQNPTLRGILKDSLWTLCSAKTQFQLEGTDNILLLKKEIATTVQNALFSRGEAKITEVSLGDFRIE